MQRISVLLYSFDILVLNGTAKMLNISNKVKVCRKTLQMLNVFQNTFLC